MTAAAGLVLGLAAAATTAPTEALYTDAEYATTTAKTTSMATPAIQSCTITTGLLGVVTGVVLVWTSSYDMAAISNPNYTPLTVTDGNNVVWDIPRGNIVKSGSAGAYTYTATMTKALLDSLLGNLLGSTTVLTVREQYPLDGANWKSPTAKRTLVIALLGGILGSSCT